jgi:GNAT superfamily N-acetyltransferase
MIIKAKNNKQVLVRRLNYDDFDKLVIYLNRLSPETVKRFGPHSFDKKAIINLYEHCDKHNGYIAQDVETSEIIAYSIIKIGSLEHDGSRLQSYGLKPDENTDCTFAPSVADHWQSQGVGKSLFNFMLLELKAKRFKRILLWGGVQSDNTRAVNYYIKNGFRKLGEFEYNGPNYDMVLEINPCLKSAPVT